MRKTLYVSNVGQTADLCTLEDLFTTVGDVLTKFVELIPESGQRIGFGVFEMSTEQQAADCMERFNGHNLNGTRLAIASERPKPRPLAKPKKEMAKRGR